MINYFLKTDSRLTNILRENSIDFYDMQIGIINGVIVSQSDLLVIKNILNRNFGVDIDLSDTENTGYEGIKQVFVSSCSDDDDDDYDYDDEDLSEEIEDINAEIDELRSRAEILKTKLERTNSGSRRKTMSPVPVTPRSEKLFEYDDTIIL